MAQPKIIKDIVSDIKGIVEHGRNEAYEAINKSMLATYWQIGRRIVDEEQNGESRAAYGDHLIDELAKQLTIEIGKGFSARYLRAFRKFYLIAPNYEIWKSRFPNLTWTHVYPYV